MKILIVGDTHFGAGLNLGKIDPHTQLNTRLIDFEQTLNSIIDYAIKDKVNVMVFTGDLFETKFPTPAQLNVFSKCLHKIISNNIKVVITVGNHDQQRAVDITTVDIFSILRLQNVFVYPNTDVFTDIDENGNKVNIILMPYRDCKAVGTTDSNEAIDRIKNQFDSIINNLTGIKLVVGHFMVGNLESSEFGENFSMNEIVLPIDMFSKSDAVIMGHVHSHKIINESDPLVMYVGSMDKTSFGEKKYNKVFVIFDTSDIKHPKIVRTKVRNLYEVEFDFSNVDRPYKTEITNKIISEIASYDAKYPLKDAIVKVTGKVKDSDLYFVKHDEIKNFVLGKNVSCLINPQITATGSRQVRNKNITEVADGKNAMENYIKNLSETDSNKNKLLKFAKEIIDEVDGK